MHYNITIIFCVEQFSSIIIHHRSPWSQFQLSGDQNLCNAELLFNSTCMGSVIIIIYIIHVCTRTVDKTYRIPKKSTSQISSIVRKTYITYILLRQVSYINNVFSLARRGSMQCKFHLKIERSHSLAYSMHTTQNCIKYTHNVMYTVSWHNYVSALNCTCHCT